MIFKKKYKQTKEHIFKRISKSKEKLKGKKMPYVSEANKKRSIVTACRRCHNLIHGKTGYVPKGSLRSI